MEKIIGTFSLENDIMSVYDLIEGLNEALNNYGLSLEVEDDEHDGFDIVILKEVNNE